jgi:hypothetical protein
MRLGLYELTDTELFSLSSGNLAILPLLAIPFIRRVLVTEIKNISGQKISVYVREDNSSQIFDGSGLIRLLPDTQIAVEHNRLNHGQINNLERLGDILTTGYYQEVEV